MGGGFWTKALACISFRRRTSNAGKRPVKYLSLLDHYSRKHQTHTALNSPDMQRSLSCRVMYKRLVCVCECVDGLCVRERKREKSENNRQYV